LKEAIILASPKRVASAKFVSTLGRKPGIFSMCPLTHPPV